jgi:hypothetical protein
MEYHLSKLTSTKPVTFLTFGDGSLTMRRAARRLGRQAREIDIFKQVLVYDLVKLKQQHPTFWSLHSAFMMDPRNSRGLGYWLWKPFLIREVLKRLEPDEVVLYSDAGCEIYPSRQEKLLQFLPLKEAGWDVSCFYGRFEHGKNWTIGNWTKRSVVDHFGLSDRTLQQPQILAGVIAMRRTPFSLALSDTWFTKCIHDHYRLLRDDDVVDQDLGVIDHRHDQAVLSGIVYSLPASELAHLKLFGADFLESADLAPIHAARNQTGLRHVQWQPRRFNIPVHIERLLTYVDRRMQAQKWYRKINRL